MISSSNKVNSRIIERVFLMLVSIVFGLLSFQLFSVLQKDFVTVNERLKSGTIVNLNDKNLAEKCKTLLAKGNYFSDTKDIDLVSKSIGIGRQKDVETIDNIGEINKGKYNINTELAFSNGGEIYKRRAKLQQSIVGFVNDDSSLYYTEKRNPMQVASTCNLGMGNVGITGIIKNENGANVSGTLVRLHMIFPEDSIYKDDEVDDQNFVSTSVNGVRKKYIIDTLGKKVLQSLTAFARTDLSGHFSFEGLMQERSYSIIPLQPGYEFGRTQGVNNIIKNHSLNFIQHPSTIKLFSTKDFSNLKKEKSLIIRLPEDATNWFWIIVACFILSFWLLHLFLSFRFPQADPFILPIIMILTGLSFLTFFSLQDPLRDRFLSHSTLYYFAGGMLGIFVMLLFNLKYFTVDSPLYRLFILRKIKWLSNGAHWSFIALGLLILTILFGSGPEGSGVKVNLFGFQPSEVVKYLIILFLAGFFSINERFIAEYTSLQKRLYYFFFAIATIVFAILLFLVLGDLGPAMVVCFTFIILFSFARGDFATMATCVVIYVFSVWLISNVWLATAISFIISFLFMLLKKRSLSESSIMALVLIAGFLLIDQISVLQKVIPGPVQRLTDRKAIWQNPWNNEVYGGDQVANGIWAMASGGIAGQGIGEGYAKTIPEAHTDMILPSIGEEFGWAGILSIFILFLLYLFRAINIGRQTGSPFLFYVCAGMGISTFIQFVLIAGGSTGALPLSGVALPFISYGGSSLLCNMLAAGFILSASNSKGTQVQMKFISKQQDKNLLPALTWSLVSLVLLAISVSVYFFNNNKWVVEPALVADKSGARMYSYNPRINILMSKLQAGNLLDRNGKIVATSHFNQLKSQEDSLLALGISKDNVETLSYKRLDRYYPFGQHMFFWTGDANTGVFNGSANGYFAEYEHAAELRGFPTPAVKFQVSATKYKEDKFLPQAVKEMTVVKRDYSALAPLLLAGINSNEVDNFKKQNRDVQLTIDAALQTQINNALATDDSVKIKRASVVIMEDNTGDVLASSSYPLPPINNWDLLTLSEAELNKIPGWNVHSDVGFTYATQPGSTAKLVTALAAFNKLGEAAANKIIHVFPQDLIRVKGLEPDEAGNISIRRAIVKSNNSFFIRLANEEKLQEQMGTLYLQSGMFLHGVGGYYFKNQWSNTEQQEKWKNVWRNTEFKSIETYNPNNIKRTRGKGVSGMSWGQGELIATPASVARIAAGIANNGILMPNRYVASVGGKKTGLGIGVKLANKASYANHLQDYMIEQSAGKTARLHLAVAGKTGTPERIWKGMKMNDGWYVFFVPKAIGKGHIVTCIRLEAAKGSSEAVRLAGSYVIPILLQRGYIKSFNEVSSMQKSSVPNHTNLNQNKVVAQDVLEDSIH